MPVKITQETTKQNNEDVFSFHTTHDDALPFSFCSDVTVWDWNVKIVEFISLFCFVSVIIRKLKNDCNLQPDSLLTFHHSFILHPSIVFARKYSSQNVPWNHQVTYLVVITLLKIHHHAPLGKTRIVSLHFIFLHSK